MENQLRAENPNEVSQRLQRVQRPNQGLGLDPDHERDVRTELTRVDHVQDLAQENEQMTQNDQRVQLRTNINASTVVTTNQKSRNANTMKTSVLRSKNWPKA